MALDQDFYTEQVRARLPEDVAVQFEAALGQLIASAVGSNNVSKEQYDLDVAQAKTDTLKLASAETQKHLDSQAALFQTELDQRKIEADGRVKEAYTTGYKDGQRDSSLVGENDLLKKQLAALQDVVAQMKADAETASKAGAKVSQPSEPVVTQAPAPTVAPTHAPQAPATPPAVAPVTQPEVKTPQPEAPAAQKPASHNPLASLFGRK